jgi:hypothetical protein
MLMVSMFTSFAGMSDAEANKEYDRQYAEWKKQQKGR